MLQTPAMSVQLAFRICRDVAEFREVIHRFVDLAKAKEAKLIVFPEITGMMLMPPLMSGVKPSLLRSAVRARQRGASLMDKARGVVAGTMAGAMGADFRSESVRWLGNKDNIALLEETYRDVFSTLALNHRISIVAGTCYRPASTDGYFNTVFVFGSDGSVLGTQDQTHLMHAWSAEVRAGDDLTPINTPLGRLGILVGSDALYPEAGRILAYRGAEVIVNPVACAGHLLAAKVRHAFQARLLENEVYGIQSFLNGRNPWAVDQQPAEFVGRSLIAGPIELVPRDGGIMTEMGKSVEGILAASLDLPALHRWWGEGTTTLRRAMRPGMYDRALRRHYGDGETIQGAYEASVVAREIRVPPIISAPEVTPAEPEERWPMEWPEEIVEPSEAPEEVDVEPPEVAEPAEEDRDAYAVSRPPAEEERAEPYPSDAAEEEVHAEMQEVEPREAESVGKESAASTAPDEPSEEALLERPESEAEEEAQAPAEVKADVEGQPDREVDQEKEETGSDGSEDEESGATSHDERRMRLWD